MGGLTKDKLRNCCRIYNAFGLAERTRTKMFIHYQPQSRVSVSAWSVVVLGGSSKHYYTVTDFVVWGRKDTKSRLAEAMEWVKSKYGITEWDKSPFGSYHPKGTMDSLKNTKFGGTR